MKPITSSYMQFIGYRVVKAEITANNYQVPQDSQLELEPTFSRIIRNNGNGAYSLLIGIRLGSLNDAGPLPFHVSIELEGFFDVSDDEHANMLMEKNGTAILFPYLRSTLTMLTALANINPIILPTINFARMFEENSGESDSKRSSTQE